MKQETEILLDGLIFPEGPRWHDEKLWFSDMAARRVTTVDLNGSAECAFTISRPLPSRADDPGRAFPRHSLILVVPLVPGLGQSIRACRPDLCLPETSTTVLAHSH